MRIKDWLSKKEPVIPGPAEQTDSGGDKVRPAAKTSVVHTVIVDRPTKSILKGYKVRQGMWVTTPDGVGIVTGLVDVDSPEGKKILVKVMLVDAAGENKKENAFAPKGIKQASIREIPEARRPSHDVSHLGYTP